MHAMTLQVTRAVFFRGGGEATTIWANHPRVAPGSRKRRRCPHTAVVAGEAACGGQPRWCGTQRGARGLRGLRSTVIRLPRGIGDQHEGRPGQVGAETPRLPAPKVGFGHPTPPPVDGETGTHLLAPRWRSAEAGEETPGVGGGTPPSAGPRGPRPPRVRRGWHRGGSAGKPARKTLAAHSSRPKWG